MKKTDLVKKTDLDALVKQFLQHKLTLAFAESCTAGLLASGLVQATGVSSVLLGSVVTYHADAKQKLLGVKKSTIEQFTAESQQTTNEMAQGLRRSLPAANVCVAITGLCGPGASESPDKPVGTVFVTILFRDQAFEYRECFDGTGEKHRAQAQEFVYAKLSELLSRWQDAPVG